MSGTQTFTKAERLCSQAAIDWLFDGKGQSFSVFPLRVVCKAVPAEAPTVPLPRLLISVPKKNFHHAVDRNRQKRLIREAYRKQKHELVRFAAGHRLAVTLAVIFVGKDELPASAVEERLAAALSRLIKQLGSAPDHEPAL